MKRRKNKEDKSNIKEKGKEERFERLCSCPSSSGGVGDELRPPCQNARVRIRWPRVVLHGRMTEKRRIMEMDEKLKQ